MLRIALWIDELHLVAPGGANDAGGSLTHRGERDVLGPLPHPVRNRRHGCRTREDHHLNVVKVRKPLRDEIGFLREFNPESRPAPDIGRQGFQLFGKAIVGFARPHQDDGTALGRIMRIRKDHWRQALRYSSAP